jgi:menaquinone-dependent protoporphyrinogen oxidase
MLVLVAYASVYGSTREIAEDIAARLTEHGHEVDVLPVARVWGLEEYDAAVLGSAIHSQAWLPDAAGFVRAHAAVLANRPTWLFSVGMPAAVGRPFRKLAMREGPKASAELDELIHPREHRLFSGVVSRDHFPRRSWLPFALMGCRSGDFRDWPEIDRWAHEIARQLEPGRQPGPAALPE